MSEQGGPEAWQKLWSMWVPSTTDGAGGGGHGTDAGGAKGAGLPFPQMPAGFPGALPAGFPGAFPSPFSGAVPGFAAGLPGFPGASGVTSGMPGAAGGFPFGDLGQWGPLAAMAAMAPGAAGMPGASGGSGGAAPGAASAANPFANAFNAPFAGLSPSLSMMSEMIAPLTQVDELDKRIADMRAVEHWLKLNLQMLQSTTQAMEVQRATLATLRAFGAASAAVGEAAAKSMREGGVGGTASDAHGKTSDASAEAAGEALAAGLGAGMAAVPALDPQRWWSMLNDQFQQMAAAAASVSTPPDGATASADAPSARVDEAARAGASAKAGDPVVSRADAVPAAGKTVTAKQPAKPVTKRSPPRPASVSKAAGTASGSRSAGRSAGTRAGVNRKPRSAV